MRSDSRQKIEKIEKALEVLSPEEHCCFLCPRECQVNRRSSERGFCQGGALASFSHSLLHYGEEPVLSGQEDCRKIHSSRGKLPSGSGTIFFSGCNLKCVFCQNFQLSWMNKGRKVSCEELASVMLDLQKQGALNINLVSPTHLITPILKALSLACAKGLEIPIVYNSNGYEKAEVIKLLEGIVDVYLPDLKYYSPSISHKFSGVRDYFSFASLAIQEMCRQKPVSILNEKGTIQQGLIIRHLVLPGQTEDSLAILAWLSENLPSTVTLSLMSQYHPCFEAPEEIQRPLHPEEYREVVREALELGFENLFIQPESFEPDDHLIPDFNLAEPFPWD